VLGFHLWELIVVLVLALMFFGPKRLPELGSSLGRSIREFRKSTHQDQEVKAAEPVPALPTAQQRSATSDETAAYVGGPTHGENVSRA
jgi:sec-independent protein translocase protein TatA